MSKKTNWRDPRGHSLRIYSDVFDSPAFGSLSPHDVMAYLALLRELKATNNADLSLPLSRAKTCGISHPKTLARSLRALCAVGLVAVTRKGGCTKGGQRLPNLYRMTDRECYAIPAKHLEAVAESNEWKRVTSVDHGHRLIQAAEDAAQADAAKAKQEKLKSLGHAVTATSSPGAMVKAKTRAQREPWNDGLGHRVNMAEKTGNPLSMRVPGRFSPSHKKAGHRAPRSTPLYIASVGGHSGSNVEHGIYQRLAARPSGLFSKLIN